MDSWLLSPSPFLISFYFLFFVTFVGIPGSLCDDDDVNPSSCSKLFNCGGINNVGFPFWEDTRPSNCGSPGLKLHCEGSVTTIEIMNVTYRVLEVDLKTQILKISREDFSTGICSPELLNTTLDPNLFDFHPGYQNITLAYGCPSSWLPYPHPGHFTCPTSGEVHVELGAHGPKECNGSVVVPVPNPLRPDAFISSEILEQVIREGFDVEWKVDAAAFACPTCNISSPSKSEQSPKRNWQLITAIGICTGIAVVAVISFVIIYSFKRGHFSSNSMVWWKRDAKNDHFKTEEIIKSYGLMAPKRYTYSNLKKLTNSFKEKVGQGGYGAVYKGKLPDGRMVAVKMLNASKGNGEEFINEVASISRTSHVNIVTLLGFCYERTKRALIYEFMPNGSLNKFIYDKGSPFTNYHLDNKTLFQIAVGVARGLEYLHGGYNTRILHFNIKPHNILLDEDLCPKISDFGFSKLCKTNDCVVSMADMRGTVGYIVPEVFSVSFCGVSHKSDVYNYGKLILKMISGRKNFDCGLSHVTEAYFPHWIYKKLEQGKNSTTFEEIIEEEEGDTIKKMIIVSLWCIQTNPSDRPLIDKVIEMLEGTLQSLQFPPKPFLDSPTRSPQDS